MSDVRYFLFSILPHVSFSACLSPSTQHIRSLSGFLSSFVNYMRAGSQAPCMENKLILTPLPLPPFHTPPQKTLLVHLRPSIVDRQYLCSLLIIFLCAVSRASRRRDRYREDDLNNQRINTHIHTHMHTPMHIPAGVRMFLRLHVHTRAG